MRVYLIIVILFFASAGFSQNVHLKGKSLSYKGKKLVLFSQKDFISSLPEKIIETTVDKNGNFELNFSVNDITKIYIPADYYVIQFHAYPGLKADILFPRHKEKPKDIYFVPLSVPAKIIQADNKELNNLIFNFDNELSNYTDKYLLRLEKKDKSVINNIIPVINKKYTSDNKFFNIYKRYSFGQTEFIIYRDHLNTIIDKYFKNKRVHTDNNAYTELFKKVFFKYIDLDQFKKRKDLTGKMLYNELKSQIEKKGIKEQQLSDYITLKILHDACFSPILKQDIVFEALNYFYEISKDTKQRTIAHNILKKITRLAEGFKAPLISGYDINNNPKSTSDYNGKYLYIIFYEPANPKCINVLKNIQYIASKNHFLEVIFVCEKAKKPACINELKNHRLQNNTIFCDDYHQVKNKFQVIVCPSYFIIDKDGSIIKAHTPEPGNNLYKILNHINIKEIREGNIKENKYFK